MEDKIKECKKCGEMRLVSSYMAYDGKYVGNICRICRNARQYAHKKTKRGVVLTIFSSQKASSLRLGYKKPIYTSQELKEWLFNQPLFHELYDKWVESGYDRWVKPSVDRKDDYKPYAFDNIQLMTWRENNEKIHRDKTEGRNNKQSRAVLQYDLDGNFIKEYYSIAQAVRETQTHQSLLLSVCMGKRKTTNKSIWAYKDAKENINWDYHKSKTNVKRNAVEQLDLNGNVIRRFISIYQASKSIGSSTGCIYYACIKGKKITNGFKWRFVN